MGGSVLLVDDDQLNLELTRRILVLDGHQVIVTWRGTDAVEMTLAHRPDLILLNMRLSGMGARRIVKRLRMLPETENVPIVAVTTQATLEEVEGFVAEGCAGYIQKPISVQAFQAKVRDHLTNGTHIEPSVRCVGSLEFLRRRRRSAAPLNA